VEKSILFWFKPTSGRTNFEENYLVNKMINESVLTNIEIKRLQSSFIVALAKH
jgi:hypothetical protein